MSELWNGYVEALASGAGAELLGRLEVALRRGWVVYVAGPVRPMGGRSREDNVAKGANLAQDVWEAGFTALSPHLNSGTMDTERVEEEEYVRGSLELLDRCDGVILARGWQGSAGSKQELGLAMAMGLPVCLSVEELVVAFGAWLVRKVECV